MGETWKDSGVGHNKSHRWSKDEGHKSSFCLTNGHLSLEECRIGDKAPKIQRSSCIPRRHCERWFWILCSIHWTRIISITNHCSKNLGYHIQTARVRRTSSGRSICLYPGKNDRCSKIIENSQIGMSRHLDSSTTTQMAKIMVSMEDPVVLLERNLYGHPLAGLLWERQFEKILLKYGWRKFPIGNAYSYTVKKDYSYQCMWMTSNWLERNKNINPMWNVLNKEVDLGEPTSFFDHVYLGRTQRQYEISKDIVDNYRTMFESRISAGGVEKLPFPQNLRISSWSYDMAGHAKKCVERYCELANKTTQQLYKVSTPCIDEHHFKEEEMKFVGELSQVLKCLYLARIGRNDILWSVNKLARSITKSTKACDKRLSRLISSVHHTCEYKQYCHVGNTAKQCSRLRFYRRSWRFEIHFRRNIVRFGSHTFVPISWMCKKQTSVSHSSPESEIISLDAGLRMDRMPALDLWDLIVTVLDGNTHQNDQARRLVQEPTWGSCSTSQTSKTK